MKLQIYDTYNPYKIIRQSSACGFGLIGTKIFSIVFIFITFSEMLYTVVL